MDKSDLIKKIILKKEFSQLPKKDVEKAFEKFNKPEYLDIEKIKLTRDLLRKVFTVFTSRKLLKDRDYDSDWILKKHISTKERFDFYQKLYEKILNNLPEKIKTNSAKKNFSNFSFGNSKAKYSIKRKINVFDLGAGTNGFSYKYFEKKIDYVGIESVGQLVDLMNRYFKKENFKNRAKAVHLSLFELEKIKKIIKKTTGEKIIFLFKVVDSLEAFEKDYSKKLLLELTPLVDRVIISFATKSLIKKQRFFVNRKWIIDFIKKNFKIVEIFELNNEKYIMFEFR